MFANFLYFIIVLLIYATYQPSETPNLPLDETLELFLFFILVFFLLTRIQFSMLEKKIRTQGFPLFDHVLENSFTSLLSRQSVMAVFLFTVDVYILNLPDYMDKIGYFRIFPTLPALLFLLLFVFYLSLVWYCAHDTYQRVYSSRISRNAYILSNISFAVPVLLPWVLLSGIHDLIMVLPFEWLKKFMAAGEGETLFFLIFLFAVALTGPLLIQKFWGCKPLGKGHVRERIETLCERAGMEYADILCWPIFEGRMITAGVMGLVKKFRYILVTKALLDLLSPEEVDAVIAHEIGHVKRSHLIFYLFFFVGYMVLSYAIFDLILYLIVFTEPLYRFVIHSGVSQTSVTSTLFTILNIFIFLVYFRYIFGYFMRNFERQADCYVYTFFDTAGPLISTFEKIAAGSGQAPDKPNWHHFSIAERVDYILKCEKDRSWIKKHDQKIKKSIAVYLIGMILIGCGGYLVSSGETDRKLIANFERILWEEIEKNPHNPKLYHLLGDLHYSRNEYAQTIGAYQKALDLKADDPEVLNNLAWLYATCETLPLRNPEMALRLALRAAQLSDAPHVLDTLAESYYVNGMYEMAVQTEEKALARSGKERALYEAQLEKFRKAMEKRGKIS
ncbi:MAG: M48 family metalloprotease [Desulfobacterales bacterium]